MATKENKTEVKPEEVKLELNAHVRTTRQSVIGEDKEVVKSLYYLTIQTKEGVLQVNVGEKTYNRIKTLTEKK